MGKIAILGGTGKLGDHLVGRALDAGYRVSVLAREPTRVQRQAEALTVVKGDAETGKGVKEAVNGCRFVVCALSSTRPVIAKCAAHLVKALQGSPALERFVFVSRVGVGKSKDQGRKVSGAIRPYLPVLKRPLFDDLEDAEAAVRASGLGYVILRSTMLTDDPSKHRVVAVAHDADPPARIPRWQLADYILKVLEEPGWAARELTVGTARE